jgi:hypothetical protein
MERIREVYPKPGTSRVSDAFVPAHWTQRDGRYFFEQGHWQRTGDRDADGVPNRYDRRPDDSATLNLQQSLHRVFR